MHFNHRLDNLLSNYKFRALFRFLTEKGDLIIESLKPGIVLGDSDDSF